MTSDMTSERCRSVGLNFLFLVCRSIRVVHVKKYQTTFKFVTVMPRILFFRTQYISRRLWAAGFKRQFSSKIQVFAVMPKAKTKSKKGLVIRRPPTTIQEGEEEVGLDYILILDSVAAQLCHERLILAIESEPRTDSPSSSPTHCTCLPFLL